MQLQFLFFNTFALLMKLLLFIVLFNGNTAIHFACENEDNKVLKYLLSLELDPNAKNNDGETPLHKASENDLEKVKILLKMKVEINAKDTKDCFLYFLMQHSTSQCMQRPKL